MSVGRRRQRIEPEHSSLSVVRQCELVSISRSRFYDQPVGETAETLALRLLSGSGVVTGTSRDQGCDERTEQGFAASARVVHELEEAEIERQLVLRDAPMRAQSRAQQRPKSLCGRSWNSNARLSRCNVVPRCVAPSVACRWAKRAGVRSACWRARCRVCRSALLPACSLYAD